ncbi:MAG: hypothetical protein O7G88_20040 [bacterium]|nr:hypothetical protein [bacterium]
MTANTLTAERLHALAERYRQGQVSDLTDRTQSYCATKPNSVKSCYVSRIGV